MRDIEQRNVSPLIRSCLRWEFSFIALKVFAELHEHISLGIFKIGQSVRPQGFLTHYFQWLVRHKGLLG